MADQRTLTARFCDSVTVKKDTEFRDAGEPGLILRVRRSGAKSWAMLYYRPGSKRRARLTLGKYRDLPLAEARRAAREVKRKLDDGDDPRAPRKCREDLASFAQLAELYIDRHARPIKRSWKADRNILDRDILPMIGELRLDRITRGDVLEVVERVQSRGAMVQAQRVFETMRGIFRWGLAEDYIQTDPTYGVRRRNARTIRDRYLSDAEIRRVWIGLPDVMAPKYASVLRLALATGQRIGEVCRLRLDHLDLAARTWTIPGEAAKNGRTHIVHLNDLALTVIRDAIRDFRGKRFLFPSLPRSRTTQEPVEQALGSMSPTKALKDAREKLGLAENPARPHDFRRTFATVLQRLGVREEVVARCLNHRSDTARTVTSAVYMKHAFTEEKREAFDAWSRHVEGLIGQEPGENIVPFATHQLDRAGE